MALFDASDSNVARWKLTSGALLTDTGGNGNNLTLTNYGSVPNTNGFLNGINTAASFNGTTQYLERADTAVLDFTTALTISAWIKPTNHNTQRSIVDKVNSGTTRTYTLYTSQTSGLLTCYMSTNGTSYAITQSTDSIPTGVWTHVAAVYNGTDIRLYINGVLNGTPASLSGSLYNASTALNIGRRPDIGYEWLGSIDDVSLWSRPLSASEIATLYSSYGENFVGYFLSSTVGTFNLTSVSANFNSYRLPVSTYASTLTSVSTNLLALRNIPIATKNFALTGINTLFSKTYPLNAQTSNYTLVSIDTVFTRLRKMPAVSGTFNLTGINIGFGWSNHVVADVRSFAFVGNPVGFIAGHGIPISTGAFTLSSVDTLFLQRRSLGADVRSYYLSGQNIGLSTSGSNLEKLTWRLIDSSGNPITGAVPTLIIRRSNDGAFYDWSDGMFKLSGLITIAGDMIAVDATNLPGTYEKTLNILNFNGKYQVFAKYTTTISQYSTTEIQVKNGIIWSSRVSADIESLAVLLDRIPDILTLALINNEMDNVLNTTIPVSPTTDSINDIIKKTGNKLPSGKISDFNRLTDGVMMSGNKQLLDNLYDINLTTIESSNVLAKESTVSAIKTKTDLITWQDITDIKDSGLGKWSINKTTNVLTMYKADGVTVLKAFNLTDNASVSERVPV